MTRWEHLLVELDYQSSQVVALLPPELRGRKLEDFSREGWEAVCSVHLAGTDWVMFKRPARSAEVAPG